MRRRGIFRSRFLQRCKRRVQRYPSAALAVAVTLIIITSFLLRPKFVQGDRPLGETILSHPFASNIIVSELNRLIFCPVPKAANSNWKYLLRKWEGLPDYADLTAAHSPLRSGLRYLSDYSASEVEHLLHSPDYFRFLFVRNPYTRILSCYMDKFRNEDPEYVRNEYRTFLAQLFGWRYARQVDIYNDPRPSFSLFVDQLARQLPAEMNAHWKPQTLLCGVGIVPYDFIGKMENLSHDVQVIFDRIGRSDEQFPTQEQIGFPPSGASKDVANKLYSSELRNQVRVIYDTDFRLFGYS